MHSEARGMSEPNLAPAPTTTLGLAFLARTVAEGAQLQTVWDSLVAQISGEGDDSGILLDLSMLLQLSGNREKGLELQGQALAKQRCYRHIHGAGGGLRIVAFVTEGDFMANTPIDFLLEGSNAELTTFYVDGALPSPAQLPEHDVAFLAIGQSDDNNRLLEKLENAFRGWPHPVINRRAEMIAALTRDGVARKFAGHPVVVAPVTCRVARDALVAATHSPGALAALSDGLAFPIIVRPIGSHAGTGLERLGDSASLETYLSGRPEAEFYVSSFFDYSGSDGLFRKLRIAFVMGRPYVAHMAISQHWMVHYLNADMDKSEAKRAEEAEMMATFDDGFVVRHQRAFKALIDAFQLDYFGIDCAETADGRLLLFEADVAMIVHAMDPPDLFPYKKPAMAKLFEGFLSAVDTVARSNRNAA
jgi:hypothetical protein